jgi:hypothetical protein
MKSFLASKDSVTPARDQIQDFDTEVLQHDTRTRKLLISTRPLTSQLGRTGIQNLNPMEALFSIPGCNRCAFASGVEQKIETTNVDP